MRKLHAIIFFFLFSTPAFAQFGVSFNQSNLPFIGLNYEINNRLFPELRIGTDNYFGETSLEVTVNYIFKRSETVNVYAGLGGRVQILDGLVVPLGLHIYPFEEKNFGFQMEVAGILGSSGLLRGSWGIRYRFKE